MAASKLAQPASRENSQTISLRRGGRVAEGAPLLREYGVCSLIEGSNPSFSAINKEPGFMPGFLFEVKAGEKARRV